MRTSHMQVQVRRTWHVLRLLFQLTLMSRDDYAGSMDPYAIDQVRASHGGHIITVLTLPQG